MSATNTLEQFEEINVKLDRVIDVMATKDDIAELRAELRGEFRSEIAGLRHEMRTEMATKTELDTKFREMMVAIDGLMKPISELKMEYTGITMQLSRHEERLVKLENN